MTIIYNYDPQYHNIFIYDEDPQFLGSRPITGGGINADQGGTLNKQLIPVRKNPSFIGGSDFDLSGVNYTFARPWANSTFPHDYKIRDENGVSLRDSTELQSIFSEPTGWTGMNTMMSQYPLGFLVSRKHLLVPTIGMRLWNRDNPRLMYNHPDKPYGRIDGNVEDKVFFMDNEGVTYEMSVTESNPDDEIVNGVFDIPSGDGSGGWIPDVKGWTVIQFDQELPVGYTYYNKIIGTETLPEGTDVLIVFSNHKAIRASYNGDSFDDFVKNIRTNPAFTRSLPGDDTSFPDYGLIFLRHKEFGTCLYHKVFQWNEFRLEDLQAPIGELEGSGYQNLARFGPFFRITLGFEDFPNIELVPEEFFVFPFLEKYPTYSAKDTFAPAGKNPHYPITYSVEATNIEGISITADAENSVVGDGSGFDYQPVSSFNFYAFPPTATEKKSGNYNPSNNDLLIYAYGSSGPVEQFRDDIVVGSTYSNAIIQAEFDFTPYIKFPSPSDFVDFKYQIDVYVDGITHDSLVGRTTESVINEAERESPFVDRDLLIDAKNSGEYFAEIFNISESPRYYLNLKWVKNFSHTQAGKMISARLRYNAIDGSTFDTGLVDITEIQPEILRVPDWAAPTVNPPSIAVSSSPVLINTVITTNLPAFDALPDITEGSRVSLFLVGGDLSTVHNLETKNVTQSEVGLGITFDVPNLFRFDGTNLESTVGAEAYIVYELEHPALFLQNIDNARNSPGETPIADIVDPNAIVQGYSIQRDDSSE